jgi:signal recognition particle receptor subunit beta/predicted  nucleic acid-binding Zn-ribbon protein
MVVYNAATRELTAKIVYYGPGLGGKTTNLHLLHDRLDPQTVGKLLNLATQTDRTIYFDLLPVELGDIKGYKIRFQLATVPGQAAFNETRRVVLKGADGIVFVADSQWSNLPKNLESWQNLKENLKANGVSFEGIPIVIQYNKRDLPDILSVDALQEALGLSSYPFVEAVASAGRGVTETFKLISKLTFVDLLRRLQGKKPEDAMPARKDQDDLLSWKESMLNRAQPAPTPARPRLAIVPPSADEAPFEAAELGKFDDEPQAEGPLTDAVLPPAAPIAPPPPTPPPAAPAPPTQAKAAPAPKPPAAPKPSPAATPAPKAAPSETVQTAKVDAPPAAEPPKPPPPPTAPAPPASILQNTAETTRVPVVPDIQLTLALENRLKDVEARLAEALSRGDADRKRLETVEGGQAAIEGKVAKLEEAPVAPRLTALEERLETQAKRQRGAEDDVGMALRSLSERGEKLHQSLDGYATQTQEFAMTIASLASRLDALEKDLQEKTSQTRREADDIRSQIETLQTALEEKIAQGRREAEDIRSQIAPLLEAEGRRHAVEEKLPTEFERMRESLAETLSDLSERLRRTVKDE